MIRVTYSDNHVQEYPNEGVAKIRMMEILSLTNGHIKPVMAAEVMGITTGGVSVEMEYKLIVAYSKLLGGWMVALNEISRR